MTKTRRSFFAALFAPVVALVSSRLTRATTPGIATGPLPEPPLPGRFEMRRYVSDDIAESYTTIAHIKSITGPSVNPAVIGPSSLLPREFMTLTPSHQPLRTRERREAPGLISR